MSSHKPRLNSFLELARSKEQVLLIGPMAESTPSSLLVQNSAVIGVDGGSTIAPKSDYDYFIGDGDSLQNPTALEFDEIYSKNKDESDLKLALRIIPTEVKTVHLWGFWGGRMDHHLFNLGELSSYLESHKAKLIWHSNDFDRMEGLPPGKHQFSVHGRFSVLSVYKSIFSIEGDCRYPIKHPTEVQPLSSLTLSNIGNGNVYISSNNPFFIYFTQEQD